MWEDVHEVGKNLEGNDYDVFQDTIPLGEKDEKTRQKPVAQPRIEACTTRMQISERFRNIRLPSCSYLKDACLNINRNVKRLDLLIGTCKCTGCISSTSCRQSHIAILQYNVSNMATSFT
jgi:hypothetical protein